MTENLYFWIGLVLTPFLLWVEWQLFKNYFNRPLHKRELVLAFALSVVLLGAVLAALSGILS